MLGPHILLFGDQLDDKLPAIRHLYSLSTTRPLLKRFLVSATDSIRCQLSALTPQERSVFGHFTSLFELAEWHAAQKYAFESVGAPLGVAIQIGEFLVLAEDDLTILNSNSNDVQHLGICLGLLAASVAASARDTSEIVQLGARVVGVTMRLGVALGRRARCIEESPGCWAMSLVGIDSKNVQRGLDQLNKALPPLRHAYIGVITSTWTTVFGPPSTIGLLASSQEFDEIPHTRLASACPVHAPHLPLVDVDAVVGIDPMFDRALKQKSVISSSKCAAFDASTLRELLRLITVDVAEKPLWLEDMVNHIAASFGSDANVTLTSIAASLHAPKVQQILQRQVRHVTAGENPGLNIHPSGDIPKNSDLIAVVGMSGRFPGSDDLDGFWQLLEAGIDMHEEIPHNRFNVDDFYDPSGEGKNTMRTVFGCFLQNPGFFDHALFQVSPKEALQMDPIQRMLLMTTYEALQQAGYAPNASNSTQTSRIATFLGQSAADWMNINDQQGIDTYYISGNNRAFAPGRLNHYFQWGGGYYSLDTACSSSSTSIHLACNALLTRECDMGVAGGGSLCVMPELFAGLSSGSFLSSTGGCKSFSDNADGYCRGEAIGIVVLKRLEDALRENDNVLAVIRGTARNSNAGKSSSIAFPNESAQESLFHKLLRQTNVHAQDVGYVEMHSPGTQAGDAAEMATVMNVFGQSRAVSNPLHVGAVKANVGHSEAAAGVVALIKSILMLQRQCVPPQPGYPFPLNRNFKPLSDANIVIADRPLDWRPASNKHRRLLVNGFDAAGGNTCLLIEDAPEPLPKSNDPRSHHIVVCSGRTRNSLAANKARLLKHVQSNSTEILLSNIAYTTTARRIQEIHREAYVVDSVDKLIGELGAGERIEHPAVKNPGAASLVFAFTGQSASYNGMGASLYQTNDRFREMIDSYQAVADSQGLARFVDLITGTQPLSSSTVSQSQMALVALEIALAHYWQSLGLTPGLVIGHSLGEYSALCFAGVLSISDTLYLVHRRAVYLEERCSNSSVWAMLAVELSGEAARELISTSACTIACLNSSTSTVVSGTFENIEKLRANLDQRPKKAASKQLDVPFGFHSKQMDAVLDDLESVAGTVHFATPSIPVASTLLGQVVRSDGIFNANYLRRQTRQPVDFVGAVDACKSEQLISKASVIFEIGPNPVCSNFIASITAEESPKCYTSLQQGKSDWETISQCVAGAYSAGIAVQWPEFHKEYQGSLRLLDLPTYGFDLKDYWVPYQTSSVRAPLAQEQNKVSDFSTTVLQTVEALDSGSGRLAASFSSQTSEKNLLRAIRGHIVNDVAICSASVFADMAYTATMFLLSESGVENPDLECLQLVDLGMKQPLVVPEKAPAPVVKISATLHQDDEVVTVRFCSTIGSTEVEHGQCQVRITAGKELHNAEWTRMQRLVRGRVDALSAAHKSHRMARPLLYKLFGSVVEYQQPYQLLDDAYVDENFQDAAAAITFSTGPDLGVFTHSPYSVDALVHLAGFLLNGALDKPDEDLHIANTIGSMHILGALTEDRSCSVYASIRERTDEDITICDVYVFDGSDLVAICTDIRFQKLTRDVLSALTDVAKSDTPIEGASSEVPRQIRAGENARTTDPKPMQRPSQLLLERLAAELGTEVLDLEGAADFASLGVNSMLSIKVLSAFKKQSGIELPASFLVDNPTAEGVKAALDDDDAPSEEMPARPVKNDPSPTPNTPHFTPSASSHVPSVSSSRASSQPPSNLPTTFRSNHIHEVTKLQDSNYAKTATAPKSNLGKTQPPSKPSYPEPRAILIQGKARSSDPPLFLIAAGIGMVAPYIHLPPLPNGRRIYALESPFLECPEQHNLTVEQMAAVFIPAIRRIQPKGPYMLGGYSAGGAYAYEITRQLAAEGETITGLLIIDMYVPQPVPSGAQVTVESVEQNGVFAGIDRSKSLLSGLTEKQKLHMTSTVRALAQYDPQPLSAANRPVQTHVVWATKGLNESSNPAEHDESVTAPANMGPIGKSKKVSRELTKEEFEQELKSWFLGKRYDFGTNGWESYVGENTVVHTVDADHYSIMEPSRIKHLNAVLLLAVEKFVQLEKSVRQE